MAGLRHVTGAYGSWLMFVVNINSRVEFRLCETEGI